jgi:hypothetical protein
MLDIRVDINSLTPNVVPISCNANLNSCQSKQTGTLNFTNLLRIEES